MHARLIERRILARTAVINKRFQPRVRIVLVAVQLYKWYKSINKATAIRGIAALLPCRNNAPFALIIIISSDFIGEIPSDWNCYIVASKIICTAARIGFAFVKSLLRGYVSSCLTKKWGYSTIFCFSLKNNFILP